MFITALYTLQRGLSRPAPTYVERVLEGERTVLKVQGKAKRVQGKVKSGDVSGD